MILCHLLALQTIAFHPILSYRTHPTIWKKQMIPTTGTGMTFHNFQLDNNIPKSILHSTSSNINDNPPKPKVVIFDLDGCLWSPEMYELLYFYGGNGAPFSVHPSDPLQLVTCANQPVKLLGSVRHVMRELHCDPYWNGVKVGISSKTDEPQWAQELLETFRISTNPNEERNTDEGPNSFALIDVLQNDIIEMIQEPKIHHFQRIAKVCNVSMEDIVFFDNEFGNCQSVASLGVTVGYCPNPNGVTFEIWNAVKESFPQTDGTVIEKY